MKITTLIENRPSRTDARLLAEWGLSLHIRFNGQEILFDTGASGAFAKNAEHLCVNVASVGAAVLSHHHYDHGGGLRRFLELNSSAKVHLGEPPKGDCFGRAFGIIKKYAGLDPTLMPDYPDRFETVRDPIEILPDVFLFPRLLCNHPKPAGNRHLFVEKDHAWTHDDFTHEIVMAIREGGKLAVFTGCAHSGILNMVDTVAAAFHGVSIKAVIGGFHFALPLFNRMAESKSEVQRTAKLLLEYPVEMTYTGHCTGARAFKVLQSIMEDRIVDIRTGSCFEV
ncbi:MAG: MBL fold metallo-hydrolase [Deltaproteobacteria bacterium]|nr:MBL fold metallo-hydrolase [Deltaproteobacteria bacterium]